MSDTTTIARPYAKAIFEYACHAKKLGEWLSLLLSLSEMSLHSEVKAFIDNPSSTSSQHIELLTVPLQKKAGPEYDALVNFIRVLTENKRLSLLPDIFVLFNEMKSEHEKTLTVNVFSYSALAPEQEKNMQASLSKRLNRSISLNVSIDASLMGGAIIQAGDLVIDGSVRGKLNKLHTDLVA